MADYDRPSFVIEHNGVPALYRWDTNMENWKEYLYLEYRGVQRSSRFDKDKEGCEIETLIHRWCDEIDSQLGEIDF